MAAGLLFTQKSDAHSLRPLDFLRDRAGDIPPNSTLIFLVEPVAIPKVKTVDGQVGKGAEAVDGATVVGSYPGRPADGTQFDSTANRDPFDFVRGRNQVISGRNQGLRQAHHDHSARPGLWYAGC